MRGEIFPECAAEEPSDDIEGITKSGLGIVQTGKQKLFANLITDDALHTLAVDATMSPTVWLAQLL